MHLMQPGVPQREHRYQSAVIGPQTSLQMKRVLQRLGLNTMQVRALELRSCRW